MFYGRVVGCPAFLFTKEWELPGFLFEIEEWELLVLSCSIEKFRYYLGFGTWLWRLSPASRSHFCTPDGPPALVMSCEGLHP